MLIAMILALASADGFMVDGNRLHSYCNAENGDPQRTLKSVSCMSYLAGVVDQHALQSSWTKRPVFCLSANAKQGQLADIVAKYLDRMPEMRHRMGSELVAISLSAAYPCGGSK